MRSKNILKLYCVIALILVSITSCEDFLTRDNPKGVTDDDFWQTMNECENAFWQCQIWPYGTYHYTSPNIALIHMEGATDNQYFLSNYEQQVVNMGNGSLLPTSGGYVDKIWEQYFIRIRRCNRFLEHINNAYFTIESERHRMIADIKVWRAWYHMQLLLWYGRNDGIPIVTTALSGDNIYQGRNTVEECLDFINKDLDEVISITDDEVCPFLWDEGNRSRMSRSSALVLKMDLNLQFKKYEAAKEAAKKLIDSNVFELYYTTATDNDPGKNFRDLFNYIGEQNKERILFTYGGCEQFWFRSMGVILGGQGTCSVLKSLVDEFETADGKPLSTLSAEEKLKFEKDPFYQARDPRLYCTVVVPNDSTSITNYTYEPFKPSSSDYYTNTGAVRSGYMLKKWLSEQDRATGYGNLDFMIYRYAEVLLTYVECLVETGDWQNPDVEKYINMVRHRAGMPNMDKLVYNTQEKVRELYRRERRVELAFEGKRYYDIRRWGIGNETMNGPIYGAWNPNANSFITIETRNCIFPKYDSWPLPQQEATANPNIGQPTGW